MEKLVGTGVKGGQQLQEAWVSLLQKQVK